MFGKNKKNKELKVKEEKLDFEQEDRDLEEEELQQDLYNYKEPNILEEEEEIVDSGKKVKKKKKKKEYTKFEKYYGIPFRRIICLWLFVGAVLIGGFYLYKYEMITDPRLDSIYRSIDQKTNR